MLVTKSKSGTWLALAICFGALTTDRFLFITLELPLTASQAVQVSVGSVEVQRVSGQTYQPVRDLMPLGQWLCSLFAVEVERQCHVKCIVEE